MRQNVRNRRYQRYKALKLYLAQSNPKFEAFFQFTRQNWSVEDNVWYEARPVVVSIGSFSNRTGTSADDGAQIKQPTAERQVGHRKSCLVLSVRFPVVN